MNITYYTRLLFRHYSFSGLCTNYHNIHEAVRCRCSAITPILHHDAYQTNDRSERWHTNERRIAKVTYQWNDRLERMKKHSIQIRTTPIRNHWMPLFGANAMTGSRKPYLWLHRDVLVPPSCNGKNQLKFELLGQHISEEHHTKISPDGWPQLT